MAEIRELERFPTPCSPPAPPRFRIGDYLDAFRSHCHRSLTCQEKHFLLDPLFAFDVDKAGNLSFLGGKAFRITLGGTNPEATARQFITTYRELLGLGRMDEMRLIEETERSVLLAQYSHGVEVEGAFCVLLAYEGCIFGYRGHIRRNIQMRPLKTGWEQALRKYLSGDAIKELFLRWVYDRPTDVTCLRVIVHRCLRRQIAREEFDLHLAKLVGQQTISSGADWTINTDEGGGKEVGTCRDYTKDGEYIKGVSSTYEILNKEKQELLATVPADFSKMVDTSKTCFQQLCQNLSRIRKFWAYHNMPGVFQVAEALVKDKKLQISVDNNNMFAGSAIAMACDLSAGHGPEVRLPTC